MTEFLKAFALFLGLLACWATFGFLGFRLLIWLRDKGYM